MLLTENLIDVFIIDAEEDGIDKQMNSYLQKINDFSILSNGNVKSPKVGFVHDHDDVYGIVDSHVSFKKH